MSVPESKRGEGKFDVLIDTKKLSSYTIQICCNEKIFKPEYKNAMTDRLIDTAAMIFVNAWKANNVLVGDDEDKFMYRQSLQEQAIEGCNTLLALMQIAQDIFHLKTKRVKFWGESTMNVRSKLRKWKESDKDRFKNKSL